MSEQNGSGDLRERIRKAEVKGTQRKVDGWGVTIELRPMSVAEKASLAVDEEDLKPDEAAMMLPKVIVMTCYDPGTGLPVFTEEDIEWLSDQPANVVEEIALAGLSISGVDEAALEQAKKGS